MRFRLNYLFIYLFSFMLSLGWKLSVRSGMMATQLLHTLIQSFTLINSSRLSPLFMFMLLLWSTQKSSASPCIIHTKTHHPCMLPNPVHPSALLHPLLCVHQLSVTLKSCWADTFAMTSHTPARYLCWPEDPAWCRTPVSQHRGGVDARDEGLQQSGNKHY